MRRLLFALCLAASPASAEGLCDITGEAGLLARLAGSWEQDGRLSLENATTSLLRDLPPARVEITADGLYDSPFTDNITGAPLALTFADTPAWDVDRVDDILETVERADIADTLSDTRCGPEALPQLVAEIPETPGMSAGGTLTLIAYFDDRLLRITELELKSAETILFMTEAALMTPAGR
jgi:hypothetical protein